MSLSKKQIASITSATSEAEKVKNAAAAMIETPMDLIRHILQRYEESVIEVMREQADEINRVTRQRDELLKVAKALVDVDFHYGPEIGDVRVRYTNGIDAMGLINATRKLVAEVDSDKK